MGEHGVAIDGCGAKKGQPATGTKLLRLLATDVLALTLVPALACTAKSACFWGVTTVATLLLTASHGGYHTREKPPSPLIASACFLATAAALLTIAAIMGDARVLPGGWIILALTPFLLYVGRTCPLPRNAAPAPDGTLVVCYDVCPADLPGALRQTGLPEDIASVFYLSPFHERGTGQNGTEFTGDARAFLDLARTQVTPHIVVVYHPALDGLSNTGHHELLTDLLTIPAQIWMAFDISPALPAVLAAGHPMCRLVPVTSDDLVTANNPCKRAFDIAASLVLLALSSPLLVACGALVRMSGPGPIIFRQTRTGAQGQQFSVLKFRTLTHSSDCNVVQVGQHDPRVTQIGRFLRRMSLDELPQLINVLRGEMSLVGPRPHAPETQIEGTRFENALRLYRLRHRVKPGMTGLAQVRGQRGETPTVAKLEQRLASDLEYIGSWSLVLDLVILAKTIPAVLSQHNAW